MTSLMPQIDVFISLLMW